MHSIVSWSYWGPEPKFEKRCSKGLLVWKRAITPDITEDCQMCKITRPFSTFPPGGAKSWDLQNLILIVVTVFTSLFSTFERQVRSFGMDCKKTPNDSNSFLTSRLRCVFFLMSHTLKLLVIWPERPHYHLYPVILHTASNTSSSMWNTQYAACFSCWLTVQTKISLSSSEKQKL